SNTGMLLSDIGLFDPLSNAFECSRSSLNAGLKHMDELSPQGMKMLRDGCNDVVSKTGPLLESLRESGSKKLEFLVDYANEKTPWLKAQASYWAEEAMKLGQLSLDWCQEKAPIVKEQVLAFAHRSFESLKGG
ncbi:Transmembrane protein 214like, partial [Caligus rogercresseyi]